MSESAYETNRMRCEAVIRAKLGTSRELGKYLLPNQPEDQAQIRVNEWRRGARPRDYSIVQKWMRWTRRKWACIGENKEKLEAALSEIIAEQKAVTDKVNGIS